MKKDSFSVLILGFAFNLILAYNLFSMPVISPCPSDSWKVQGCPPAAQWNWQGPKYLNIVTDNNSPCPGCSLTIQFYDRSPICRD